MLFILVIMSEEQKISSKFVIGSVIAGVIQVLFDKYLIQPKLEDQTKKQDAN